MKETYVLFVHVFTCRKSDQEPAHPSARVALNQDLHPLGSQMGLTSSAVGLTNRHVRKMFVRKMFVKFVELPGQFQIGD